jgi:hypothetical protein
MLNDDIFYQTLKEIIPNIAAKVYHTKNCYGEGHSVPTTKFEGFSVDDWEVPTKYGLENSEPIIPTYYISGKDLKGKLFECDFHFSIVDSIRNVRILSKYQQEYIEKLDKEDCYELLREYNKVMKFITEYVMADNN